MIATALSTGGQRVERLFITECQAVSASFKEIGLVEGHFSLLSKSIYVIQL